MTEEYYLHRRSDNFAKTPEALIHDTTLTDGAFRLYAHLHWRAGQTGLSFEGRKRMAQYMDVSQTTITNRVNELVQRDWVHVVVRSTKRGRTTNEYHVFEYQSDCRDWRADHGYEKPPLNEDDTEPKRKGRKGVGGRPAHRPKDTTESLTQVNGNTETPAQNSTQVDPPNVNSSLPTLVNSSLRHDPESDSSPDGKLNTYVLSGASASTPDPFGGLDDLEPKQRELLNKAQAQAATVRLSSPALNDQATQNPTGTDSTTTPPQSSAKVPPAAAMPKPPQPHIAIIDAWHWNIPESARPIGKPAYAANVRDAQEIVQAGVTAEQVGAFVKETYPSFAEWAKQHGQSGYMSLQHVKKSIKAWLSKDNIVPFKPSQAQQTQEQKAANSQSKTKYFKLPKDAKPWEDL